MIIQCNSRRKLGLGACLHYSDLNPFAIPQEKHAWSAKMQGHRLKQCLDPVPRDLHTDTN
jgi:hypothetical protein